MLIALLIVLSLSLFGTTTPASALSPVACTADAKLCPDGVTYVGRDGSRNCQWHTCPIADVSLCGPYLCVDGTLDGNRCAMGPLAPCLQHGGVAQKQFCSDEMKVCPDGITHVSRDGNNNCEWKECPSVQTCSKEECGPAMMMPNVLCADGSMGGPVCSRNAAGVCAYRIVQCSVPPVLCSPYRCTDGTTVDRCTANGTVINYFAAPCLTHGGEADASQSFSDVPASHPNAEAIAYVKAQGMVEGYYDGTYRPDVPLVRAEFVKIVGSYVFGHNIADECGPHIPFSDVGANAWYARYVCRAYEAHLINGYPNGLFVPAENINVVEGMKIVALANELESHNSDLSTIESNPWYERYVRYLAMRNAIPMSVTSFDKWLTRGEMAEMIYRLKTGNTDKKSQTYEFLSLMEHCRQWLAVGGKNCE